MARGGSRGGDRGDGPGADAGGSRDVDRAAGADAGADLDPDAPGLEAMRAVWLEMRDEAPPERGMAELLAAARRKAAALRPGPTLWQRLLAATRRPAVLALATAVVLIGGAVVVGRRVSDRPDALPAGAAAEPGWVGGEVADPRDGAHAPIPRSALPGSSASPTVTTSATSEPPEPRVASPAPSAPRAPPSSSPPPAGALVAPLAGHASASDMTPAVPGARPERAPPARPRRTAQLAAEPRVETPPPPAPPGRAPAANDDTAGRAKVRTRGAEEALGPSEPPTVVRPQDSAPATGADTSGSTSGSTGAGDRREDAAPAARSRGSAPSAGLAQLHRACEAAARRGDCAAVRRIVDQISRIDQGYRGRIGTDSAVARCLAE